MTGITHRDLTVIAERRRAFSDPGWIFEVKYDGFRMLATHSGEVATLSSRNGTDYTTQFPELRAELAALPDLVLDGELVILDAMGHVGEQGEKLYAAVDGLQLEGIVAKRADSAVTIKKAASPKGAALGQRSGR